MYFLFVIVNPAHYLSAMSRPKLLNELNGYRDILLTVYALSLQIPYTKCIFILTHFIFDYTCTVEPRIGLTGGRGQDKLMPNG